MPAGSLRHSSGRRQLLLGAKSNAVYGSSARPSKELWVFLVPGKHAPLLKLEWFNLTAAPSHQTQTQTPTHTQTPTLFASPERDWPTSGPDWTDWLSDVRASTLVSGRACEEPCYQSLLPDSADLPHSYQAQGCPDAHRHRTVAYTQALCSSSCIRSR